MSLPVHRPSLAITLGDPRGIGPEVGMRAARAWVEAGNDGGTLTLLGPESVWAAAARLISWAGWRETVTVEEPEAAGPAPWENLPEVAAIATAVTGIQGGRFSGMVTAPLTKARLLDAGFPHPGHTEYLAALAGCSGKEVMTFLGGRLRVALLTTHLPLHRVPDAVRNSRPDEVIQTFHRALVERFGVVSPRLALCGLNPHAGEQGHLGTEEKEVLEGAVAKARREGVDVVGPLPADTLFARAVQGEFDGVVACYHDQGLVAVKTLDPGGATHITLGLPFVRTSPDHGSALDIAGKGIARGEPMGAALLWCHRLSGPMEK